MRQALSLLLSFYRWGNWGWIHCRPPPPHGANTVPLGSLCCSCLCICVTPNGRGWAGFSSRPWCPALEATVSIAHHFGGCPASEPPSWVWRNGHCVSPDEPHLSLQKPKTQTRVLPIPAVLPACQMTPSRTQIWMRDREKKKSFWFHFITRVVSSGILSAGWLWMELRVQRSSGQWQPGQQLHSNQTAPSRWPICPLDPSASPSIHSASCLPSILTTYPFSVSRPRFIPVVWTWES